MEKTALHQPFRLSLAVSATLLLGTLAMVMRPSVAAATTWGWQGIPGLNGTVLALAVGPDGLYVGGGFTDAGGDPKADYLARWNGSQWSAVADPDSGTAPFNEAIEAITFVGDTLYVGGIFTNVAGNSLSDHIAVWDGHQWSALAPAGAAQGSVNCDVRSIVEYRGAIYAGGCFTDVAGIATADGVAKWSSGEWSALGSNGYGGSGRNGAVGSVEALAVWRDDLYVGGGFTNGAGLAAADYVARWDGEAWSAVGEGTAGNGAIPTTFGTGVRAMTAYDGRLWVGGSWNDGAGNSSAGLLMAWDGRNWNMMARPNAAVHTLLGTGDDLYIGGLFTDFNADPAIDHLMKFDGAGWLPLDTASANVGFADVVTAILIADGQLYAGGRWRGNTTLPSPGYMAVRATDDDLPVSWVQPLPRSQESQWYEITWEGSDTTSGIDSYRIDIMDLGVVAPADDGIATRWEALIPVTRATSHLGLAEVGHRYCFRSRARDVSGNVEAPHLAPDTCTRIPDTHSPIAITMLLGDGSAAVATRDIGLVFYAIDEERLMREMRLSQNQDFTGAEWIPYAEGSVFELSAADGEKAVFAQARDLDGNLSDVLMATVVLDTVPPTVSLSAPASTPSRSIAITLGGTDSGGSGITAWAIVEGTTVPASSDPAWVATKPATFQLSSGDATKTVSAFSRDAAGNVSTAATASVLLDAVAPTVDLTAPSLTTTRSIAITVGGTDGTGSGITSYAVVEGTIAPASNSPVWVSGAPTTFQLSADDATKFVSAFSRDAVGNVSSASTRSVVLDATAPTASLTAPAVTNTGSVAVTVGGTDGTGSGITAWAVVEGTTAPASHDPAWVSSAPPSLQLSTGDAAKNVSAFTRDAAGNVSVAATRSVVLDTVPPTVSLSAPASTPSRSIAITLGGTDSGGSGITAWAIVEGTTVPASSDPAWVATKPATFQLSRGNGDKTISAFGRDAAGNVSSAATRLATLAALLPSVSLAVPAAVNDRQVALTLTPVDTAAVGITRYLVSEDPTTPAQDDPRWTDAPPATLQVSAGEGSRTLSAWVRDANGNISGRAQATTLLDTTAPTVTLVIDDGAATTPDRDVTLTVTADDGAGSGATRMRFGDDGTTSTDFEDLAPTRVWRIPAGAGDHTVWVRVRDAAGNVATASDTITLEGGPLDTTPPVASPPTITLPGSGKVGTTVTVRVAWAAAIDDTGVASYVLQKKVGTGAWTTVTLATPLALSATVPVTPGTTVTLRFRAFDGADNPSDWQVSAPVKASLTQETSTTIRWTGTWTSTPLTGASGGKVRYAKPSGRKAAITVTGSSVALVSTRAKDRGKATLWIDGVKTATIDLYATTTQPAQLVWMRTLAPGLHTVELRTTGTKRSAATGTRVDLDAWLVLG